MEFKLTLPDGSVLEYKKEPMSWERFQAICILIGIFLVGSGVLQFFRIAARA